jgi:hypothetical protein
MEKDQKSEKMLWGGQPLKNSFGVADLPKNSFKGG